MAKASNQYHKDRAEYYFSQEPSIQNLARGAWEWMQGYVFPQEESGALTGEAPLPGMSNSWNLKSLRPFRSTVMSPEYYKALQLRNADKVEKATKLYEALPEESKKIFNTYLMNRHRYTSAKSTPIEKPSLKNISDQEYEELLRLVGPSKNPSDIDPIPSLDRSVNRTKYNNY